MSVGSMALYYRKAGRRLSNLAATMLLAGKRACMILYPHRRLAVVLAGCCAFTLIGTMCAYGGERFEIHLAHSKTIYFVVEAGWGSSIIRGEMVAETMKIYCKNNSLPWHVEILTLNGRDQWSVLPSLPHRPKPDACIMVKQPRLYWDTVLDWCRTHGAVRFVDVLDQIPLLERVTLGRNMDYDFDGYIMQSLDLMTQVNAYSPEILTLTLYNHHTNSGFVSDESMLEEVDTVGLYSPGLHFPPESILKRLAAAVCSSEAKLFLVFGHQNDTHASFTCNQTTQRRLQVNNTPSLDKYLAEQVQYHDSSNLLSSVNLGLLWPPDYSVTTLQRPPTRLLHWMSHGLPVAFFPYKAYLEVARDGGYFLDDGTLPSASSPQELQRLLHKLCAKTEEGRHLRRRLRSKGLEIASNHTLEKQTERLVHYMQHIFRSVARGDTPKRVGIMTRFLRRLIAGLRR
ncbi:unnamed protein product [Effrenium voratum]|uniref:Uncharacterized protein n=1 Tax=Effrenium voratum TaxID=2562239 RepID=A0AA36JCF0_9DINO|nr:unnamed protein product [Effrenium voratum]CAJ1446119.1 unnamed protein product [Effrenium voratum]